MADFEDLRSGVQAHSGILAKHRPVRAAQRGSIPGRRNSGYSSNTKAPMDYDYEVNVAGKKTSRPAVTTTTTTTTTTTKPSPANEETTRSVAVTPGTGDGGGTGTGDQDGHTVTSGEDTQGGQSQGHVETEHDQKDFSCKPVDGQYSSYIEKNFEAIKTKCQEFQKCTDALYSVENFHHVLAGKPIQLSNMCGLLYKDPNDGYGRFGGKCSEREREAISQDMDADLLQTLTNPPDDSTNHTWVKLRRCLSRGGVNEDENRVNGLCRLKVRYMNETRLGYLCQDPAIDQFAQDFFNHKLEHLHCSCEAVIARENTASGGVPLRGIIGMSVGLGLIGILIIVIIILCCRHRKLKRRLTKERLRYLPSPADLDNCECSPVYQEIKDINTHPAMFGERTNAVTNPGYPIANRPPTLPHRYVRKADMMRSQPADNEYLEPLADLPDVRHIRPGDPMPGQGLGLTYDLARHPDAEPICRIEPARRSGPYEKVEFHVVTGKDSGEEDGGYSTLGRRYSGKKKPNGEVSQGSDETAPLNDSPPSEAEGERTEGDGGEEPKYFLLEPEPNEVETQSSIVTQL